MSETGGLALVGHTVKDMDQLAGVAQVLRDPRIETVRLFLVDTQGRILAQTAVTSRLPGRTWIWPRGMTEVRWMNRLERQMQRLGATGYYVLHNHPSGTPELSPADVQVTRAYAERLPGLLGHVVINDVEYGAIDPPKRDSATGRLLNATPYVAPLRPEDLVQVERGRAAQGFEAPADLPASITTPQELAAYGKLVQRRLDRGLTVVYTDGKGKALWVAEFRAEAALRGKDFEDELLGLARSVGGFQASAVVRRPSPEIESALEDAMEHGCFRDVWVEGTAGDPNDGYSFQQRGVRPFAEAVYGRGMQAIQEGTRSVQEAGPEEGGAFFLRRRRLADEASARLFDEEIVADLKARQQSDIERQRAARAEAEAEGGEARGAPRGIRFTGPLPGAKAPPEAMEQGSLKRVADKLGDEGVALGRFLLVTIPQGEFVFPSPERLFRSLGPAGEELFQRGEWAKTNGEKYGSELSDPLWLAWRDLDRGERRWLREKFVWAYEDKKPLPTPGIVKFAEAWRAANTWIGDRADELGLMVTPGQGGEPRPFAARDPATYVPHRLTADARDALRNRRGRIYQRLIEEAKGRGIPAEILWELVNPPLVTKRHGSLEHPRLADLPRTIEVEGKTVKVLEDDPAILGQHIVSATRRLAIIEQFGQEGNTKYLQELAERMVAHGMDAEQAEHMIPLVWRRLQGAQRAGNPFMTNRWKVLWNAVEAAAAGSNLSLAVVPNLLGGHLPLTIRHGVVPATKAFIHAWTTAIGSADETRIRRLAYLHQDLVRPMMGRDLLAGMPITETIERLPARIAGRVLRTTGFQLANRKINQAVAWSVDRFLLDSALDAIRTAKGGWLAKRTGRDAGAAQRYLTEQLGFSKGDVERMAFGEPTEADVSRAMQKEIENVNAINESAMARPPHIDNTLWRLVMAYTTYFRKFAKTSEWSVREARRGNLAPLMRLLFVGPVTGAAIVAARDFLKDRKREDESWWAALYTDLVEVGTLGLWTAVDYGVRHFGEFGHEFFPDVFNPPQTETLNRVATGLARSWRQGTLRPLFQNVAFTAPIVDVAEKVFRRYDPNYIAERLSRMVYTGRTVSRGRQHEALEPMAGRENTARMLLERWRGMGRSDEELLERIRALRARPAEVVGE